MNRVGIVRQSVRDRIEGRAIVTGPPLRRMSKCLLCNLDSGPWLTTQAAEVSGLLHITGHHACMGDGSWQVDPSTIPDPDADLIEKLIGLLDLTDPEDAREVIAAVRAHDEAVQA